MTNNNSLPNMQALMQKAQEMQNAWSEIEEKAAKKTVTAEAGAGMVTVIVSGRLEVKELKIEKELITSGDVAMVEDLVQAAINEGIRRARTMMETEMQQMAGQFNMPGITV